MGGIINSTTTEAINDANPNTKCDPRSEIRQAHRVTKWSNEHAAEAPGQTKKSRIGTIKASGLSHKHVKQSDLCLAWTMFHKIVEVHREIEKLKLGAANVSCDVDLSSEQKHTQ